MYIKEMCIRSRRCEVVVCIVVYLKEVDMEWKIRSCRMCCHICKRGRCVVVAMKLFYE